MSIICRHVFKRNNYLKSSINKFKSCKQMYSIKNQIISNTSKVNNNIIKSSSSIESFNENISFRLTFSFTNDLYNNDDNDDDR